MWTAAAVAVGITIRFFHIARSDFPLNDGGLFVMMIEALRANHYRLPAFIPWGQFQLPFAYPPFAFYLAAVTGDLTGISDVELLRVLPALGSAAAIVAFAGLARAYLADRVALVAAVVSFGIMPGGYGWVVAGGGLTRGFGEAFMLAALHQLLLQLRTPSAMRLAAASGFASLTALTHPESALVLAVSAVVLVLSLSRTREGLRSVAVVGAAVLVLTAPWWVVIADRHGVGPFLASGGNARGMWMLQTALPANGSEGVSGARLPLLAVLLLLIGGLTFKRAFASAWFFSVFLSARNVGLYSAPSLALLVGRLFAWLVLPFRSGGESTVTGTRRAYRIAGGSAAGLLFLAGARVLASGISPPMPTLDVGERAAMSWIRTGTPPDASFLLLTGRAETSAVDPAGDWFGALSGRRGLGPPQGTEWLGLYPTVESAYARLLACRSGDTACLERWAADESLDFDYVYVSQYVSNTATQATSCCDPVLMSLRSDPGYRLVFEGAGASVFERVSTGGG